MDIFTISGRNYDSNVYVIIGKISTIVDTGTGFYSREILNNIKKFINPTEIKQIILTHEHYDHVGGVLDILKATEGNAKILAHKNTVNKLKKGESDFARMLGGKMPRIKVDIELSGGERIVLGDETFEVLHTPGHSLGSISLYGGKSESLFSGDTVFSHGDFGRYDLRDGDFNTLLKSIEILAELDVVDLYPGHGPIVERYGKDHVSKSFRNIQMLI